MFTLTVVLNITAPPNASVAVALVVMVRTFVSPLMVLLHVVLPNDMLTFPESDELFRNRPKILSMHAFIDVADRVLCRLEYEANISSAFIRAAARLTITMNAVITSTDMSAINPSCLVCVIVLRARDSE